MRRVLIGDFGAIATLGLRELLEHECEIVGAGTSKEDIATRVRETAAEVVLVDSDAPGVADLVHRLAERDPSLTVIGCSLNRPRLTVLSGPRASYTAELEPSSLLEAVNGR